MALVIEVTTANGAVSRVALTEDNATVEATAGSVYRLVPADGKPLQARIHRVNDDLVIRDLPGDQTVTLEAFFLACGPGDSSCALQLDSLGGDSREFIRPDSEPIAAMTSGEFLLWASAELQTATPVAPESEFSWKPVAGLIGGLAVIGGAGGSSGGGVAVGTDSTPDRPAIQTDLVSSRFPVINGVAPSGSVVTVLVDLGGSGATVSFRIDAAADGSWSVNTASAAPFAGAMPDDGLPLDAPSPIAAVATTPGGNSEVVTGLLQVDVVAPGQTAAIVSISSDAAPPAAGTLLNIQPGVLSNGDSTNDTSPSIAGTISAPLAPDDVVLVLRNGAIAGQAEVNGLEWQFADSAVPAGQHSYTAQVADPAGNRSAVSNAITISVDGTAPAAPSIDPITQDDIITLADAQAGVAIIGNAEAGVRVSAQLGAVTQIVSSDSNGVYSAVFGISELPGNGRLPVRVTATDSFGNQSETVERLVNIATGLPGAPIIDIDSPDLAGDIPAIDATESSDGFTITGTADPGNAVVVTFEPVSGGQSIRAEGVVDVNSRFALSFAPGALADGQYELRASITDFAGQVVDGPVVTVVVDSAPPGQRSAITSATDSVEAVVGEITNGAITNDSTPRLNGVVSGPLGPDESVQILLNGAVIGTAPVNGLAWQFRGSALPEGTASWTVRVVDAAGNSGPDSEPFELTLDLTAPAAPSINVLAGNDIVTRGEAVNGIDVAGTGPANGTVSLNWAGERQTVSVDSSGNWAMRFASPPAEGRTQITATVSDAAGNTADVFRTVTVDTQPPPAPGIGIIAGNDVVNAARASNGVTVSGTGESGSVINLEWGNQSAAVTASNAGFWTTRFDSVPPDGNTVVRATASDAGGNQSTTTERSVVIDTQGPATPRILTVAQDNVIDAAEAAGGILVNGITEAGTSVVVRWGSQQQSTSAQADGAFQVVFNSVPAEGPSTISATATDGAGNVSPAGQLSVTVNTTLPPPQPQIDVVAGNDLISLSEASQGLTMRGSAQVGAEVSVGWAGTNRVTTVDAAGNWQVTYASNQVPPDGNYLVTAVASNIGGTSPQVIRTIEVDTTPPAPPVIDDVAGDNLVNASEAAADIVVRGQAQANATLRVQWENLSESVAVDSGGQWQAIFARVPADGDSIIRATAADAAGNVSAEATRDVRINTVVAPEAPQIAVVSADNVVNLAEAGNGVRLSGSSEPGAVINITWGNSTRQTTAGGSGAWTLLYAAEQLPADGNSTVSVTASNVGGMSPPALRPVIIDLAPPATPIIGDVAGDNQIDAGESASPIAVTGSAEPGNTVQVTWGNATASDVAGPGGEWSVTFSNLPVDDGISTLTAISTDSAGNDSDAGTQQVNVASIAAPAPPEVDMVGSGDTVNAIQASSAVIISGTASAGADITVSWGGTSEQASATASGTWSVTFASAQVPPDGLTILTAIATNAGGSSDTASRIVTVDTAAPAQPEINPVTGDNVIDTDEAAGSILVDGTAESGSRIDISWGTETQSATTSDSGLWSVTFATLPVDEDADIAAIATDAAGNPSGVTINPVTVSQPPVAPDEPVINLVSDDDIVNLLDAASAIAVTGDAPAAAQVTLTWGQTTQSVPVASDGTWNGVFAVADIPADGLVPIVATASADGVDSAAASRDILIDTLAPAQQVTISDILDDTDGGATSIGGGGSTSDVTPTVVLDLDIALQAQDTVVLFQNGIEIERLNSTDNTAVTISALEPGEYTFSAQVVDGAENPGLLSAPYIVNIEI